MSKLRIRLAEEEMNTEEPANEVNSDVIVNILNRIQQSGNDIRDAYYILLDNLNALYKDYPGVYNELKVMVKLPDKKQVENIAQLELDIEKAIQYLSDPNFLNGLLKK